MLKKLVYTAIHKRWLMLALFILLGIFGYLSWKQLAIEAYPDIADVSSQVVTQVPGLAAEEIELQITVPLERELNGMPGVHVMRSSSSFGLSIITLVFQDGVDDYFARQRIQERLVTVELPYDAAPELDPLTSPIGEVYRYIIESSTHSLRELTDLQNFEIIPRLNQIPGVAEVTNFGGITTQFQVEIDPTKLELYDLSLSDVVETIEENNVNAGGSMLTRGDLAYVVRGIGLVSDLDDLGNIVVSSEDGVPVFLKDLGELKLGNLERKGVLGYSDRQREYDDGIQGIVLLLKNEDSALVLEEIHEAIDELNGEILPDDVRIHTVLDRTELIDNTLSTVSRTITEGIGLVIIILIVFLHNWRGALLVAVTIPLSLLIAFILMNLTNIPANLLSLGAIDFGIIVDGAIVMMEFLLKKREDEPDKKFDEKTITEYAYRVAKPIFFATLIIIIAYMPLFAFERVEKKLFTPMAFTVGYALLGALAVALLLIPGLAYYMYKNPRPIKKNKWLEKLQVRYHNFIEKVLNKPKQVIPLLISILLGAGILSAVVGKDFLPELDEGSIWLQVQLPPGISFEKAKKMSDVFREKTMEFDEVTYVMVQAGRNDDGTDPWTTSHFEVSVGIKPYKEWPRGKTKADLIDEMTEAYASMPGYNVGFSQPMIDGVMDKIAGAHSELVVKVFGNDFKETRRIAEDIVKVLEDVKGAVDIAIDQAPPSPQVQIIPDREAIAQYGLQTADVAELIEVAIGGKAISSVFIDNRVYDVTARYTEDSRDTPEKLESLMLTSSSGAKIPLSQVADVVVATGESTITREMNKRHLTVKLNIRNRDLSSLLKEAQNAIEEKIEYDHHKYHIEWGGQFENQERAYARLGIVVPITLAFMFLLLYGAFGKLRQATLLISIVPLALFGGMLALNIRGMTLNVSSAVGFIALFGVAIQNGVIMISHINDLRKRYDLRTAVQVGAEERLRPVLMTATVAALGLFPASMATGIGSDVQRPLATVIVYGLLFSTIITLYILPAMYYLIEKRWGQDDNQIKIDSHEE